MRFRNEQDDELQVNITPLIDIVFILLIFFMVTTSFEKNAKLTINLPQTSNAQVITVNDKLDITIDTDGNYFVNKKQVLNKKPETVFHAINAALGNMDILNPPVVINADSSADYQYVITAMDIVGRLGLNKVSLSTKNSARQ